MISKALVRGIYQKQLTELARLPDVELTLISPPAWREGPDRITLERRSIEGYGLEVTAMAFNGHYHFHFYPRLGQILGRLRPDIVHIDEEPYNIATWQATRIGRHLGARVVFFTWQNIFRPLPLPFTWIQRSVFRQSQAAIAGNKAAQTVLRRHGFAGPISVIPQLGVDLGLFKPLPTWPLDQPFTIGYVGRLVAPKGVHQLLEACAQLTQPWRLQFIGEGPERDGLTSRARALGLSDQVTLDGPVPSGEIPGILRRLDVVVLPSLSTKTWKEQFGRVLAEAMASGTPVIGSDSGEIPEVIGDAGLTFPEGDVSALRACLGRLQADPALRAHLRERGLTRSRTEYGQAQIASRIHRVYQTMMP